MKQTIRLLTFIGWIASLITLLFVTSCNKKIVEDPLRGPEGISGTWILDEITIVNCIDYPDESYTFTCSSQNCIKIHLTDNGTYTVYDMANGVTTTHTGTYSTFGDAIDVCLEGEDCTTGRFEVFLSHTETFLVEETDPESGCITTFYYVGG